MRKQYGIESEEYVSQLTNKIKLNLFFPYFYNYFLISSTVSNAEYVFGREKATYSLPRFNPEDETISFSFCFADDEVYKIYHPAKEEETKSTIEKGVFFDKQKTSV